MRLMRFFQNDGTMKEYEGKLLNNDCGIATVDKMIMNREEDVSRCRNFSSNFLMKQEAAVRYEARTFKES